MLSLVTWFQHILYMRCLLQTFQLFRKFTFDDVEMRYAVPIAQAAPGALTANWVEKCTCLPGYKGINCEQCAEGFTREPSFGSQFAVCRPCFPLCQLLSNESCDPESGVCRGCFNNTRGAYCQACNELHYRLDLLQVCFYLCSCGRLSVCLFV